MSEFQSYQWDSVGRALLSAELKEVGRLSSHISVTATGARVTCHWGDSDDDPR